MNLNENPPCVHIAKWHVIKTHAFVHCILIIIIAVISRSKHILYASPNWAKFTLPSESLTINHTILIPHNRIMLPSPKYNFE
jgi:hypothetical protein